MIEIEIDGKKVKTEPGSMIIKAADDAGVHIPRFCYHKKLSIAANCRMCLVEVENAPKTLPACATPVAEGMKIFTQSEETIKSQKSVMEFLLINHPLDCPICDQGGECELQDLSMGYGKGISRFNQGKRSVEDKDLGPLISSEMTRCIHCTRCVRFGDEIAGMPELGVTGRGEEVEIGTYIQHSISSELSGNVIDLCPVGALTSKPYRFTARAWEMQQHSAIAPHDCLGSHIFIHTRGEQYEPTRQVMRVVPRENESINETWISDRDRFSYQAVNSDTRLTKPMVKNNGGWQTTAWNVALNEVATGIQTIAGKSGVDQVGGLISSSATTEEHYLFQKWLRALGVTHIDHRLQQTDFKSQVHAPLYPTLGFPIAELDHLNACLLVGSNMRHEQPMGNYRLRKAANAGSDVMCVSPIDYDMTFDPTEKMIAAGAGFINSLAEIVKALSEDSSSPLPDQVQALLEPVTASASAKRIASKLLKAKDQKAVLLGAYASNHPNASVVRLLSEAIANLSGAKLGELTHGANAAGAWIAGTLPHRSAVGTRAANTGLDARRMLESSLRVYVLFDVEPEKDAAHSLAALKALKNADIVIAFTSFSGEKLKEYADIILPIAPFTENTGTYVNAEGLWQTSIAPASPKGEARPGWEVLKDLLNFAENGQAQYETPAMICAELKEMLDKASVDASTLEQKAASIDNKTIKLLLVKLGEGDVSKPTELYRITHWPMYQTDMAVRNAGALQAASAEQLAGVSIHSKLAKELGLKDASVVRVAQEHQSITLPLIVDDRIPEGFVDLPAALDETAGFGDTVGVIELSA